MQILDLIRSKFDAMTAKQRSIAQYLMEAPEEASYLSLKEMSRRTRASEVSILRFCGVLGFSGFIELKEALRNYTKTAFKSTVNPGFLMRSEHRLSGTPAQQLAQICMDDRNNLNAMIANLDPDRLFRAARDILRADRVVIFAHDKSYLFANYLRYRLNFLRIECVAVQLGDSNSLPSVLANLGDNDCMILFSFLPYHQPIRNIAEFGQYRKIPIITITDSPESPAAAEGCNLFICPTGTRYYFNSQVSTTAFINTLASCIAIELGPAFDDILASEQKVTDFLAGSAQTGEKGSEDAPSGAPEL